jgi:hypothetical protein
MRMGTLRLAAGAAAICLPLADAAVAQEPEPDPNVPVQSRARPDYDPLGLRAGAFLIYPELSLLGGYDSNVFAEADNEKDAFVTIIRPGISAESQWSRHALNVSGFFEEGIYTEYTRNGYTDYGAFADGRIDITRADRLNLDVGVSRAHEDRDSPDSQEGARSITQYYLYDANVAYRHDFARLFTVLRAGFRRNVYEDAVGGVDNSTRDRDRYTVGARVGHAISPRFTVFLDGAYRWVEYDEEDSQERKRDNQGYAVRAGTGIDITSILFGELYVGYSAVTYDESGFSDASSPGAGGRLTWNVTPLTSIILNAAGEIRETTVTQDNEEASANLQSDVTLAVWHELLRNLLINGYGQYIRDDFEGINRTDNTFRVGGGVRYLINRNFSLDANYTFSTRDSDESDAEYDRNQVLIGVTARL